MKKYLIVVLITAIALIFSVSTVFAGELTITDSLTPGGATMPVVATISTPNCTGGTVAFSVLYAAYPFTANVGGTYNVYVTGANASELAVYLMDSTFDPTNPVSSCITASNTNTPDLQISATLTAGESFYVVVIEDTFTQDGAAGFQVTISGPDGFPAVTPACPYPLPAGSVVRSVPAGAPTFFAPDLGSQINDLTLPAGTWYVSAIEGDFALVWIACQAQPIYIPVNAIAP